MIANQCCICGAEMPEGDQVCARCRTNKETLTDAKPCVWCGPGRIGWFSVQFWVRACYGKRKWMSVTQDWKYKVKFCPVCGREVKS